MKKISNTAFVYTIVALVAGVVYREYTKVVGFSGKLLVSQVKRIYRYYTFIYLL